MWVSLPRSRSLVPPLESLEKRRLLSAVAGSDPATLRVTPAVVDVSPSISPADAVVTNSRVVGYSPGQIATAYRTNNIEFGGAHATGAGQTIAIVDAYNDKSLLSDLDTFDQKFALPAASLTVMSQTGSLTCLPGADPGWARETALDVEWAHATAPDAHLLLVEADDSSLQNLMLATNQARHVAGVSVVSLSWGTGEFYGENLLDDDLLTPTGHSNETFVAASGDGYAEQWPASSPNVLSVGGTFLSTKSDAGTFAYEKPWIASGGGYSAFESEPDYQQSVQFSGDRTTPDVSFDADPDSGFAVYDSVPDDGQRGWVDLGGTSAGAPQWAGLIAIADQGRALEHADPLNTESVLTSIYAAAADPTADNVDFHDVWGNPDGTPASIYVQQRFAGYGYDLFTGFGSPRGVATDDLLLGATLHPSSSSQFVPVSVIETTPQNPAADTVPATPSNSPPATPLAPHPDLTNPAPPPVELDLGDIFGHFQTVAAANPAHTIIGSTVAAEIGSFSATAHFIGSAAGTPMGTMPTPTSAAPTGGWIHAFADTAAPVAAVITAPLVDTVALVHTAEWTAVVDSRAAASDRTRLNAWLAVAILAGTAAAVGWLELKRNRRADLDRPLR